LFDDDGEEEQVDLLADFVKESRDKGLADLETGSEVYMSEMLGFEIEDAEEMEEQNEEDLVSLQDSWGEINLKQTVIDELKRMLKEDNAYIMSCVKHLESDDKELWKKYIAA
jgi:importin-9